MAAPVCIPGIVALALLPRVSAVAPFSLQRSPRPRSSSKRRFADDRSSESAPRASSSAGYLGAAAVIMRSLVCLYLVVVKSAVATVAGPTTVGGITVVLVSAGLVGALPEAELEAVLAHEVAHPANGDGRVVGTALGPMLATTSKRPP